MKDECGEKSGRRTPPTCHPIPRLRTDGGGGVALAYLEMAMKAPVDCGQRGEWGPVRPLPNIAIHT